MSEKIPYHPSLTIGNIVEPSLKKIFDDINKEIKLVERAKEKLNSLISSYRSIEMTEREINSLSVNIDIKQIENSKKKLRESIEEAAQNYIQLKIVKEERISNLQLSLDQQNFKKIVDSPIDYTETSQKSFPWAVDSLKLDYQYFSFKGKDQTSNTIDNVRNFLDVSTKAIPKEKSSAMANEALSQLQNQHDNHNVKGTLIMSATCTHKNILILNPIELDPNKAINAWNALYEDDFIDTYNKKSLLNTEQDLQKEEKRLTILSGAVYGSCFIAMVHFLEKNKTNSYKYTEDFLKDIKEKLTLQKWFSHELGNIQMDKSQEGYIKDLLSDKEIDIHLNLYVTGAIPTIGSQKIDSAVQQFSLKEFEIEDLTDSRDDTLTSLYNDSKKFQLHAQATSAKNFMASQLLNSLEQIDKEKNAVLDVNTMVTAFENYIEKITSSNKDKLVTGVPIHYYTISYTKAEIIKLWIERYKNTNEEE